MITFNKLHIAHSLFTLLFLQATEINEYIYLLSNCYSNVFTVTPSVTVSDVSNRFLTGVAQVPLNNALDRSR